MMVDENIVSQWMEILKVNFTSVSVYNGGDKINEYTQSMSYFKSYVKLCSTRIMSRLHGFLRTRLPLTRPDLLPGRTWVWDSLCSKVQNIAAIMIISGHVVDHDDLLLRDDDECILTARRHFVSPSTVNIHSDMNGNYLVFDKKRHQYFRSGMAELGMNRRWKE